MSNNSQKRLVQIVDVFAAEWLRTQAPIVEEVMVELSRKLAEIANEREL
jgi:hypothetical protein